MVFLICFCVVRVVLLNCILALLGDLKKNASAIGLAIKHCGLRPSLPMFEQAAHQFFALALPRGKDFCSNLHASGTYQHAYCPCIHKYIVYDFDWQRLSEVHGPNCMRRRQCEWCMPFRELQSYLFARWM